MSVVSEKPSKRIAPRAEGGRKMIALKILPDELKEIDRLAGECNMTRTEYMIRSALQQPTGRDGLVDRIAELEKRIDRLERRDILGA